MEIKRVACVGAGVIGHSWAALFSMKGFSVNMYSRRKATLNNAVNEIKTILEFFVQNKLLNKNKIFRILARIETTTNLTKALEDVDYVQESVIDNYDVKKDIFKEMDKVASKNAILASSSSGLLMTEIQKVTKTPGRCVLVHPWNPPILMPLVEIAGGEKSSKETIATAYSLMLRLDKVPIILHKEVSGYIANRIQAAVLREAIDLLDKNVASAEDIDKAVRAGPGLRWAIMGPFLTHHLGGKGIERFITNLGPSYTNRWKSMATWNQISPSAEKKIIDGVNQLQIVKSNKMEELVEWRNNLLEKLLENLGYLKKEK